ncbi:hypothetical protein ACXR6G_06980 [Ancylomarina sp. YFZ004]
MEVLRMNDYNIYKTSKATKVTRVTLSKWRDDYRSNLPLLERFKLKEDEIAEKGIKFREIGLMREGELIEKTLHIKNLALNRLKELINEEKNMDRLSNALKTLHVLTTVQAPGLYEVTFFTHTENSLSVLFLLKTMLEIYLFYMFGA